LSTAFTSSANWPKSADKIDGAMTSLFIVVIRRYQAVSSSTRSVGAKASHTASVD
jgi:hypothetical protein